MSWLYYSYRIENLYFFSFGLFLGILIKRSAFAVAGMLVWGKLFAGSKYQHTYLYAILKFADNFADEEYLKN